VLKARAANLLGGRICLFRVLRCLCKPPSKRRCTCIFFSYIYIYSFLILCMFLWRLTQTKQKKKGNWRAKKERQELIFFFYYLLIDESTEKNSNTHLCMYMSVHAYRCFSFLVTRLLLVLLAQQSAGDGRHSCVGLLSSLVTCASRPTDRLRVRSVSNANGQGRARGERRIPLSPLSQKKKGTKTACLAVPRCSFRIFLSLPSSTF
jgi:hypothetical protein